MSRTPSLSVAEAETLLGPRGHLHVNSDNRLTVRKWLTAQGFPALFCAGLSQTELALAYNQIDGSGLAKIKNKLAAVDQEDIDAAPVGAAVTPPANQDALELLRQLLLGGFKPGIDVAEVTRIVQEQLANIGTRTIEVKHDDGRPPIKIDGLAHPDFERALKYLQGGANLMLIGPAGCGKTFMAKQLATALDTQFGMISGSAGVSEGEFKGWLLPVEGGRFDYCPSNFVKLFEGGNATIVFDEMDAFDANGLLCANVPLANGHMYVQQRRDNPTIKRGERVFFIGTANTYGTGGNPVYAGRNQLDAATLDRFVIITVDYDKRLEEQIGAAGGLTAAEMAGIWELRDRCREAQLRRVISTRAFQKAAVMKRAGDSWREIRDRLLEGWTKDEKAKVGV